MIADTPLDADKGDDDVAWREHARNELNTGDAALAARFDSDEDIDRLLAGRAALVDALVRAAWQRAGCDDGSMQLLATGGYGRGELFPYSDIDLLVLAEPRAQKRGEPSLARFFTLLWDAGLATGHAVRSLEQCVRAAKADVTVMTALSEWRMLAGNTAGLRDFGKAMHARKLWPAVEYFTHKRDEQRARHARYNDTAYNLEPNLKEGPGGLRDIHTLVWMARRIHAVGGLADLVPLGVLGEDELASLERERRVLSRLRYGLHLVAGRREERLLFDLQKVLAERQRLRDERADNLAVEQLMQQFYRAAATVLRINDRLLQRFEEQLEGRQRSTPIDAAFEYRHGYLALRDPDWLRGHPERVFRVFATWAAYPELRGLHSETARAVAEALPSIPDYRDATPDLRAQFVEFLRGPAPARSLHRMATFGVLARWLPEFGKVSGRMQFDLFHVYTVDQHTLAVLTNIAGFTQPDSRFVQAHEVWPRLRKPELLLLAALFHDIAKGRGGDHSQLGALDAEAFCRAHRLSESDTALVVWLVREHLLMSVTAQRQDISDPEVINRFATHVADRERLDYLYLLTVADIAGTSPKLWNAWKDRLLADLYAATRFALRRGLEHPVHGTERINECRQAARSLLLVRGMDEDAITAVWANVPDESFLRYRPEQLAWQTEAIAAHRGLGALVLARPLPSGGAPVLEVFVHAPDSDGLFAAVAASLDRMGLNVLAARVLTAGNGMSLDTFQVLAAHTNEPDPERLAVQVRERLRAVLGQPLDRVRPARRALPRYLRHFRVPTQIELQTLANGRSQLALICTDRPGLLALVASVLRRQRLRVHAARIATFGERVEDFFQITDEQDRALCDPVREQALRQALIDCVDGDEDDKKARP